MCTDVEKVVDMLKADELPKKAVFCRCWRSEKVRSPSRFNFNLAPQCCCCPGGAVATILPLMRAAGNHTHTHATVLTACQLQFPYCDGAHVKHNQVGCAERASTYSDSMQAAAGMRGSTMCYAVWCSAGNW
jgi:CDGSH-type Zn-finger protein